MGISNDAAPAEDAARRIGADLKLLRLSRRLTRKDLGGLAGVPVPTLRRFEETGLAPALTVVRLARALSREGDLAGLFASRDAPSADPVPQPAGGGRMAGRTVLVMGAGSVGQGWGNGKAAAVAFAREGAWVACADRDAEAAEATAAIVRAEGGTAVALTVDVREAASVAAGVAATMDLRGRIDVLHNNVGTNLPGGMAEADEAGWAHVFDVNLTSVFRTCRAVLPIMAGQGAGAIVNVSSLAAIRWTGYPYVSYMASKAGLNQLTRAIAIEYAGQGIRANTIMPGILDTPHVAQSIARYHRDAEAMAARRAAAVPMGRQGDAWDVAWAAVFLASDQARFITGAELPVDGGQSCTMRG